MLTDPSQADLSLPLFQVGGRAGDVMEVTSDGHLRMGKTTARKLQLTPQRWHRVCIRVQTRAGKVSASVDGVEVTSFLVRG